MRKVAKLFLIGTALLVVGLIGIVEIAKDHGLSWWLIIPGISILAGWFFQFLAILKLPIPRI